MAKRFKLAGETCVYCTQRPATTSDHVFGRCFFLVPRRDNLPQVPACAECNGEKAAVESYLATVVPFGGRHADAVTNLSDLVPPRLAKNRRLHRELAAGMATEMVDDGSGPVPAMTLPFQSEKLVRLFEFVAKGLAWHHWRVVGDQNVDVWAGILNAAGEALFNPFLKMKGGGTRVEETLGVDTFSYVGVRSAQNPEMSLWLFTVLGGLQLSGDPDAPHEKASKVGVLFASKLFIERFKARLAT